MEPKLREYNRDTASRQSHPDEHFELERDHTYQITIFIGTSTARTAINMPAREITVINVPSDIGSMIKGKHLTPAAFQFLGVVKKLSEAGFKVDERDALPDGPRSWSYGAPSDPNGVRNEKENAKVNQQVKDAFWQVLGVASPILRCSLL